MKIYIACGLTHVPRHEFPEYVELIYKLAEFLERSCAAEVKYALRNSDPQLAEKPFCERASLCYIWDREMVEWADLVIAEASFPSTGVGIELQIAANKSTPIVIVFSRAESHKAVPIDYRDEREAGAVHSLQLGDGFVTLMALGLPSVMKVIPYSSVSDLLASVDEMVSLISHG